MRYRTILIDDEPLALGRMERLLKSHSDFIEIVGTADSGLEAVEKIDALKPDLIFLDIQMPELNGFDVIERIRDVPFVIFATAYDQYALKAFETNSVDYLLKPIEPKRLEQALHKLQNMTDEGIKAFRAQIQSLLADVKQPLLKRIQVKCGDHIRFFNLEDVYFFRSKEKYVEVATFDESHLITLTLSNLESQLPAQDFARIHRSAIVNLDHIDEVTRDYGGTFKVRMKNREKTRLPVSRHLKSKLGL